MSWWQRLFGGAATSSSSFEVTTLSDGVVQFQGESLALAEAAEWREGLPFPDFVRAREWIDHLDDESYGPAWLAVQRGWLGWLAACFGGGYRLVESERALLVTAADDRVVRTALAYLAVTQRRVARSLAGIASERFTEKPVVLLLNQDDDYYRYLSGMVPEEGDYPMSAGVHFGGVAPHFAVNGTSLDQVEATIVHEMTHAFVTHLPIPAWLNEGLAVNMEMTFGRVADPRQLIELQGRHRKFWTPELIQDYWSGRSWLTPGDANELSYDLGRLMVAGMSEDWPRFERFVLAATGSDAGARAAEQHLDIDLGEYVRHYLEREDGHWAPQPEQWRGEPERGAF